MIIQFLTSRRFILALPTQAPDVSNSPGLRFQALSLQWRHHNPDVLAVNCCILATVLIIKLLGLLTWQLQHLFLTDIFNLHIVIYRSVLQPACEGWRNEDFTSSNKWEFGRGIVDLRNFPKVLILFNTFCFIHGRGVIGWQYELSGSSQPKIIWQWLEIFFWFKNCQAGFEILMTARWRGGSIVGWRLYFANNLTNISTDKYYGGPTWLTHT